MLRLLYNCLGADLLSFAMLSVALENALLTSSSVRISFTSAHLRHFRLRTQKQFTTCISQKKTTGYQPLWLIQPLMGIDGNAGAQGLGQHEHIPHNSGVGKDVLLWPSGGGSIRGKGDKQLWYCNIVGSRSQKQRPDLQMEVATPPTDSQGFITVWPPDVHHHHT